MVSKVGAGPRNQGSEGQGDASGDTTSTSHGSYPRGPPKLPGSKKYTYLGPTTRNSKSVGLGYIPDIRVFLKLPQGF